MTIYHMILSDNWHSDAQQMIVFAGIIPCYIGCYTV